MLFNLFGRLTHHDDLITGFEPCNRRVVEPPQCLIAYYGYDALSVDFARRATDLILGDLPLPYSASLDDVARYLVG